MKKVKLGFYAVKFGSVALCHGASLVVTHDKSTLQELAQVNKGHVYKPFICIMYWPTKPLNVFTWFNTPVADAVIPQKNLFREQRGSFLKRTMREKRHFGSTPRPSVFGKSLALSEC